jgi:hypothetical protein
MRRLLLLGLLLTLTATAQAQQTLPATIVQQSPTLLNACTPMNATAAVNTAVTLTITAPPSGQYIYICGIDLAVSFNASAAVASTNVSFTSTNLGPAGATWAWKTSWVGTANAQPFTFQYPVRATSPGTAVTIVAPAIQTTTAYSITAYYYVAP